MPNHGPLVVTASRPQRDCIDVEWHPLSLVQARGFITNYSVTLEPINMFTCTGGIIARDRQPITEHVHNSTSIHVCAVSPSTAYTVSVSAATKVGRGPDSKLLMLARTGLLMEGCH